MAIGRAHFGSDIQSSEYPPNRQRDPRNLLVSSVWFDADLPRKNAFLHEIFIFTCLLQNIPIKLERSSPLSAEIVRNYPRSCYVPRARGGLLLIGTGTKGGAMRYTLFTEEQRYRLSLYGHRVRLEAQQLRWQAVQLRQRASFIRLARHMPDANPLILEAASAIFRQHGLWPDEPLSTPRLTTLPYTPSSGVPSTRLAAS
jgi:hypothetical protein